jgi:(p)ppGpp synthase/HD superfamily hydrolase
MDQLEANSPRSEDGLRAVQDILKAAHFAAERHSRQRRKGAAAEPYINHLLEVAEVVSTALSEPDTNLVVAALLHDAIEDVGVTKEELIQVFGADVAELVAEVTDDKSLPKAERKRLQIVNARRSPSGRKSSNWPTKYRTSGPCSTARQPIGAGNARENTWSGRNRWWMA